ncbi:MAG TPA: hypothetical protein VFK52_08190 [Nocardioidaceae bacterium]|nr:hypothetical protein [Nocardioidaceae bacterium]
MRLRVVLVTLVVVALVAGASWWFQSRRTTYESALATLPSEVLRASYTDWAGIRSELGDQPLDDFTLAAYDRDFSRTSALEANAPLLESIYGIDLRAVEWEVYGQSDEGSVAVLKLGSAPSFDDLTSTLTDLGYPAPSQETKAWAGSVELVATIDSSLTPVFQNVVLLEEESLVLLSDSPEYAEHAAAAARGDDDALLSSVSDLADQADQPISALLWAGDYACKDLAMSTADAVDQNRADALVDQAGGVSPLTGLLMAAAGDGAVRVGLRFEDDDQATDNLQPRTDLAAGEAPGLGGAFADRFSILAARTSGRLVLLDLEPAEDGTALLSGISDGPVLFATC